MSTKIEWTDATWNPTIGCTRVSAGCDHCYAFELHDKRYKANRDVAQWVMDSRDEPVRRNGLTVAQQARELDSYALPLPAQYDVPFSRVQLMPDRLEKPLHWKKPRKVLVNSMSDLFHEDVPDEFIDRVFAVMALTPQHTYQVLTKRPERMREYVSADGRAKAVYIASLPIRMTGNHYAESPKMEWPLSNVWLGTSVEDQAAADERIPHLLATPAAVRFLSCEPLLGELRLWPWTQPVGTYGTYTDEKGVHFAGPHIDGQSPIDWVIVGGESGSRARPFNISWARSLRDQCAGAGVPFFMKQLGSDPLFDRDELPVGARSYEADGGMTSRLFAVKLRSGHGSDPAEWPEDLRIRQFPGDLTSPDARSGPKQG